MNILKEWLKASADDLKVIDKILAINPEEIKK